MSKEDQLAYFRSNILPQYTEIVENKPQEIPIRTKKCIKCERILPVSKFYKNPLKSKGVFDYCKECAISMAKENRIRSKLRIK